MARNSRVAVSTIRYAALATLLYAGSVAGAAFPDKPITMIMPYGAGGPPDAYGRLFAEKLQKRLGQPVIVENRPGANGTIGAGYAAKAKPDGYTILYGSTSSVPAAKGLFKSLSYDPVKDLVPVTILADAYFVLAVPIAEKNTTFPEYLEKIRKNPEKYPIGGASTTAEVLSKMMQNTGLDYTYIRYAGSSQMVNDLLGGRLGGMLHPVAGAVQFLSAGTMHGMAVASPERLPAAPEIPTISATLPGIDVGAWTGFFVPTGTPQPVIDTLYGHIAAVLKDPAIIEISELGGIVVSMTPAEAAAFVQSEIERWPKILQDAGIDPS